MDETDLGLLMVKSGGFSVLMVANWAEGEE